jgi:hypothetical protein
MLNATFCYIQNIGWGFSLSHYGGDKIPLNWYRLWNISCLLRLPTPLPSNVKALFYSRNILHALNDATVLLAGPCYVGHKKANRLHAHGSACTLVASTQDVALDRAAKGIGVLPSYMCKIEGQLVAQRVNLFVSAPTCFGLNCWPSSGSPQFFSVCILCVNLCGRNSTYDWTYCNAY